MLHMICNLFCAVLAAKFIPDWAVVSSEGEQIKRHVVVLGSFPGSVLSSFLDPAKTEVED
jgi:hypothetical protein